MRISDWSSDVCSSDLVTVLTNQTPFYGESGGQMGDAGTIATLEGAKATVSDTGKPLGRLHTHQAKLEAGTLKVGDTVQLTVRSEEHTSELQSLMRNSYAVFCLKKKKINT